MISSLVKRIFSTILRNDSRQLLIRHSPAELIRLRPALEYVDTHLESKIRVAEMCKQMNVSYHYFVKYFKKTTGIAFLEYVNRKKIKRAEELILTTNLNIADIGEAVGLPNMTHFYDLFNRYNRCSPRKFRQMKERWAINMLASEQNPT
jgi:AraC-like DNA-binding protein